MLRLCILAVLTTCLSFFNGVSASELETFFLDHLKGNEEFHILPIESDDEEVSISSKRCRGKPIELSYVVTLTQIGTPVTSTTTLNFTSYVIDPRGKLHTGTPVSLDFPIQPGFTGLTLSSIKLKRQLKGSYTVGYFVQSASGSFAETSALSLSGGVQAVFNKRVEYIPFSFFLAPYPILNVATVNISSQLAVPNLKLP